MECQIVQLCFTHAQPLHNTLLDKFWKNFAPLEHMIIVQTYIYILRESTSVATV